MRNGRRDLLAANRLGRAIHRDIYPTRTGPVNVARFVFLDTARSPLLPDWDQAARHGRGNLRTAAGSDPHDRGLADLVGELSTRSDEFRRRWASHNVHIHRTGVKDFHHHVVGELQLTFEAMELPADPGLSLVVYSAAPGRARPRTACRLLATWAATLTADAPAVADDVRTGGRGVIQAHVVG